MDHRTFQRFCEIAYEEAGITLQKGKEALVSARVARRMRALDLPTERAYLSFLQGDGGSEEVVQFLDAISTNFTHFFREPDHFEVLRETAQRHQARGGGRFRLWCAASSTGEEPYSLAITLHEVLGESDWRVLATDISTRVLEQAKAGRYPEARLAALSRRQRGDYFERTPDRSTWRARPHLRRRLVFKRLNLARPPFPLAGNLQAVFCRNVMIYFDNAVRQRLISELSRLLRPGSLLIIGHSETLAGIHSDFVPIRPSVYHKPGDPS